MQIIDRYDEPVACPIEANSVGNRWGFPPPRSWFEEAAPFTGAKLVHPPVEGDPLTLEKYLAAEELAAPTGRVAAERVRRDCYSRLRAPPSVAMTCARAALTRAL